MLVLAQYLTVIQLFNYISSITVSSLKIKYENIVEILCRCLVKLLRYHTSQVLLSQRVHFSYIIKVRFIKVAGDESCQTVDNNESR